MVLTNSKRYDSKSNDNVRQNFETSHRGAHRNDDPPDHPSIHWMVEYPVETINWFKIINKKLTPRDAIGGKHALRIMPEFGQNVLWLPETWESGRMEKSEPNFEQVVWLGECPRTDEAIIGASNGIVRAGTVKR